MVIATTMANNGIRFGDIRSTFLSSRYRAVSEPYKSSRSRPFYRQCGGMYGVLHGQNVSRVMGQRYSVCEEGQNERPLTAYLNAKLKEMIYMKPPRGVLKKGQEEKVLKLKKGLYGLKQAGRGWYQEMSRVFVEKMGFSRSSIDHSVFYRRKGEEHTIVAIATDDMAVTSKQRIDAEQFKTEIKGLTPNIPSNNLHQH